MRVVGRSQCLLTYFYYVSLSVYGVWLYPLVVQNLTNDGPIAGRRGEFQCLYQLLQAHFHQVKYPSNKSVDSPPLPGFQSPHDWDQGKIFHLVGCNLSPNANCWVHCVGKWLACPASTLMVVELIVDDPQSRWLPLWINVYLLTSVTSYFCLSFETYPDTCISRAGN